MSSQTTTGVTTFETPDATSILITRVVKAPRHLVFDAYTVPKHIQQWLLGPPGWTMPVCEFDARVGGAWRYTWRKDDGAEMTMSGLVTEIEPPQRVVTTERWGPEWPETINAIELTESSGHTTITTTVRYPSQEARDAALQTGMKTGMEFGYTRLDALLESLQ